MTIRIFLPLALLLLTTFFSATADGEDKSDTFESHFDSGVSPNGRTEITVLSKPGELEEELELRIMDVKSGRLLGGNSFADFASFAVRSPKPSGVLARDDIQITWRSDSQCVALSYVMTRGFVGTTIYAAWGGLWVQMPLPDIEKQVRKFSRAAGRKRVVFTNGSHGHESSPQWLPHNRLRLDASYGYIQRPNEDAEVGFWVTFRVINGTTKSKPRVVFENVEFEPGHASSSQ